MAKKTTFTLLAVILIMTMFLGACTDSKKASNSPQVSTKATESAQATDAPKASETNKGKVNTEAPLKELNYPDAFPKAPKAVDYDTSYAYDDMSKHYTLDIMDQGFINQPATKDTIKEFYEKTFNLTINFTHLTHEDLINKVNVRFASGDAPDVVAALDPADRSVAQTLFKQGQLLDATKILPYMPQMMTYVTKEYKSWATDNENMVGIPRLPLFPDVWGPFIRQDWLKKLGLEMPKTADDLFNYAKAVTEKDPDGNGKSDTWFAGGAGGGQNFGMLDDGLRPMFGHTKWNVKDGKINNPMLDGSSKNYLMFMKKLNDSKVLAPDWYTIQWEQFKAYTLQNKIGLVNYPGWNIMQEQYLAAKNDVKSLDYWAPVPPLTSGDGIGGKLIPGGNPGGIYMISKKAGEEPGKLMRIAHFLDAVQYPNKYYWVGNQGGGPEVWPDYTKVVMNADGTYYYDSDMPKLAAEMKPELKGMMDWQMVAYTLIWEVHKPGPDVPYNELGDKYQQEVKGYPRYQNFEMLLNLDGPTSKNLTEFVNKNEIAFVLGKRSFDDWDKYVEEWKKAGGQKLMEQAATQLKVSVQ
jgi:putative aldouronate transport system substrate-binding protein